MANNNSDEASLESGGSGGTGVALKKGPWTAAEDSILVEYVKTHGEGNWNAVQKNSGLSRCGKSCRLRWANHLRPNLKKGSFSPDEERLILELHAKLGNKWARMAAQLPGRTDNEIKNYWNTRVKRRQRAGLPLYPHDIQKQAVAFHLHQQHQPRLSQSPPPPRQLSLSQKQKPPNYESPLSLFDPINFSSSSSSNPLLSHYGTPLLPNPIHRFKQFRDSNNVGFSVPFSPPPPPPPPSSLLSQSLTTHLRPSSSLQFSSGNFDLNPPLILQTPFEPNGMVPPCSAFSMKLELPSSQLPQPAAAAAASGETNDYMITPILGRSNSGLLDAMLLEAQAMAGNEESKRECLLASQEKCALEELFGDALPSGSVFSETATTPPMGTASQWDDSSSAHSSIGVKKKKEAPEEINSIDDDLSSLLDIIPSNMSVPGWYRDSGEMSNGPSLGVTDNDMGLEMKQLASSISVATTATPDWTMGSCPWDNMPGIC